MLWIALCLPLMIVGVAIATLPLAWAIAHEHRTSSSTSSSTLPDHQVPSSAPLPLEGGRGNRGMNVCAVCSSVVLDSETHFRAVHVPAA